MNAAEIGNGGPLDYLGVLAELVAEPLAEYDRATAALMADVIGEDEGDLDPDQCDEIRDEASYHVLEVVRDVLAAARAAGILPDADAEPVPYWPAEVTA